jgi:DNA-binding NtrC family response regulator
MVERRWLIVEDEALVAMSLEDALSELGLTVEGPYARIAKALPVAETADLGGAVLDVNVAGARITPVAAALERRGIPFVFVTGYGVDAVDARFRRYPLLNKPFVFDRLQSILRQIIAESANRGA